MKCQQFYVDFVFEFHFFVAIDLILMKLVIYLIIGH